MFFFILFFFLFFLMFTLDKFILLSVYRLALFVWSDRFIPYLTHFYLLVTAWNSFEYFFIIDHEYSAFEEEDQKDDEDSGIDWTKIPFYNKQDA